MTLSTFKLKPTEVQDTVKILDFSSSLPAPHPPKKKIKKMAGFMFVTLNRYISSNVINNVSACSVLFPKCWKQPWSAQKIVRNTLKHCLLRLDNSHK